MEEMKFKYSPITYNGDGTEENRVTKEDFTNRMELEGAGSFIKSKVIDPFEKKFKNSKLEELTNKKADLTITKKVSKGGAPTTSWKSIYTSLKEFLEVRADDSRAASHQDVEKFPGIGYCIAVPALTSHIEKLTKEATTFGSESTSINWPKKGKNEEYPNSILIPDRNYEKLTKENLVIVQKAKRFISGIKKEVVEPFTDELKRWFETNTGYNPKNIPDKKTGFVERILELEEGSYIQMQLIRKDDPEYKEIIGMTNAHLQDTGNNISTGKFKHTMKKKTAYINIKSIYDYLSEDNLDEEGLVKSGSRYLIIP